MTPAHQFPTGVVLAPERRAELLEWAEDADGLIVEDDYDSELRYDRVPVGALQGLAPERVIHIGSLSKRLAPGLSIGWILSPSWLSGALTFEKALADGGSPAIEQLAACRFHCPWRTGPASASGPAALPGPAREPARRARRHPR